MPKSSEKTVDSLIATRKKTLLAWKSLVKIKPVVIMHLLKNTIVKGTLVGITDHESMIAIQNLETPLGLIAEAKIRVSDVEYIEFTIA